MSVGDAADLVEVDGILGVGDRVEEVDLPVEPPVDRSDPAEKRRHADAAGDPYLIVAALAIIEAAERAGQLGGDPRAELVIDIARVIARGLDRHLEAPIARGARYREGMALPAAGAT